MSEKAHLESRIRSDLLTIESKFTQCETENISLRRRLQDVTENRDREVAQYQIKVNSLEKEIGSLMDDISRMRRNQSMGSVGVGGNSMGYNSGSGYSNYPSSSSSSLSSVDSRMQGYSSDRNERLSYPSSNHSLHHHSSSQYNNEPIGSNLIDHTSN